MKSRPYRFCILKCKGIKTPPRGRLGKVAHRCNSQGLYSRNCCRAGSVVVEAATHVLPLCGCLGLVTWLSAAYYTTSKLSLVLHELPKLPQHLLRSVPQHICDLYLPEDTFHVVSGPGLDLTDFYGCKRKALLFIGH